MSCSFTTADKIIYGESAIENAGEALSLFGKKAFIVTGKTVCTLDCFARLTDTLKNHGIEYEVFSEITGEPDDKMINEGLNKYKASGCDFLIGIGGGSPLDSMKAIAALYTNGGKIADCMGVEIGGKLPKMAAMPTTAGTGSEVTKFTVITDSKTQVKMLLKGDCLIPNLAVIDSAACIGAPKSVTVATALDALTHAVESYTSKKAQPLTDVAAISSVKRIFTYLPSALADGGDKKARFELSLAALEAGMAINNASITIVHGMSRPIGALFHVSHGLSNAMLLVKCMEFAKDGAYERFAALGRAIGVNNGENASDKLCADRFVEALGKLCADCGVPTLKQYGIDMEEFMNAVDKMAADAIKSGSPANTIKPVTESDVKRLYRSLWA